MAKPRIIIADTDANYIIPLQLKFVEEFFEKVDLEIITEEDYFNELFLTPQRADILIVSEELYDSSIQRHNISHVFLMTEQYEEESTADLLVKRIFKYTSIKEIFNEIIGKSAEALNIQEKIKKETQVILVYSASGGTGKTTVAMGISGCLTQNYKNVLYINAERLQTFQNLLENKSPISTSDIYAKLNNPNDNVYGEIKHIIRKEIFNYLPPFKGALMSLGIKYSVFEKIIMSAKRSNEYDFIVVDADVAFDDEKAQIINLADKVIIVTEQTENAVCATNVLVSNINGINQEKYIFVCNKFRNDIYNALITPKLDIKFPINEYIGNFGENISVNVEMLTKQNSIRKIAFLVM